MSATERGASPWSLRSRVALLVWEYAWLGLCQWTPKPFNAWRLLVLRAFGAKIEGRPFVHQRARIQIPWNVSLGDGACIGDRAALYSLDKIVVERRAVIAQEAYLCTGTHDFTRDTLPLVTAPVRVMEGAFVGARAFLMPDVTIGSGAVVGACAVVTRNVEAGARVKGNPAR
jgi:putative colanic acid biosynthesis acetyltransferase WcaF